MPTPFTSTFASAAASTNGENSTSRTNNSAGNEWSRSRVNGATQTFRRPSVATTPSHSSSHAQSRDMPPTPSANNGGVYIPPHLNANHPSNSSRSLPAGDIRYSKDQLLSIYQTLKESSALDRNLEDIFLGSWDPLDGKGGMSLQPARGDTKDQVLGPEVCWNYSVDANPFGLTDPTEEEKQLFSTSVNSPIKPQQSTAKESSGGASTSNRKASLSSYSATAQSSRPGTRRRETSESYNNNGPLSPVETKTFFRGESNTATPPPALLRRRTDYKEEDQTPTSKDEPDVDDPVESQSQFPGLRRVGTGPLSAGLHPPTGSPWSTGVQGGAFGSMGSFGSFAVNPASAPAEGSDKRPGFGSARGGSRFKDLLSKTSSEDINQVIKDKASFAALEKLPEEGPDAAQSRSRETMSTRPGRSETNPFDEIPGRSGSAALGGSQEAMLSNQGIEQMGFSSYGPHPSIGTRDFGHDEAYQQTPHGRFNPNEPMSPTNTNPYQSPHARLEDDEQDTNDPTSQAAGLPPFGAGRRNVFPAPDERGAGSGIRGPGAFGGLGFGGPSWSGAGLGSGKPALDRGVSTGFGDPIFSPLTDLQSPGAGALGGGGFFGAGGFGSAGRASRLGAMFPPAMQDQMRGDGRNELPPGAFDGRPDSAQHIGRDPFDSTGRRLDGFGRGSSAFEDSPPVRNAEEVGNIGPGGGGGFGPPASGPQTTSLATPQPAVQRAPSGAEGYQSAHGLSQSSGSNSSNQMPAAQQRQMVMPDRMRWIYRDPQGNTQGPWSGLEMHDWFKAGFFTAELQVKKLEDAEYEPLAQLVRRIGNSREPFLVPQIGVPHGPPSATQGNHWATSMSGSAGSAQPPFASSFPSFGTTLTAEQQNALERRKQEEQFLMARQKEHLAQQQMAMKHMQMQNGLHSLQHHSSAHSLQSQPSFGSITSPTGYQPSPLQGPIQPPPPPSQQQPQSQPGQAFGPPGGANPGQGFGGGRDEDVQNMMDRLSFSQRANLTQSGGPLGPPTADGAPSSQQVSSMLQDRARLQQQQQQSDLQTHQDTFLGQQGRNDRLEEFRTLRGEADSQAGRLGPDESLPQPIGTQRQAEEPDTQIRFSAPIGQPSSKPDIENLSLAQQVQIAAASQQAAAEESAWARKEAPIEPPPVSISPLPAPAAQRNRQHVADALAAESRSATHTPIETPTVSIAPWAERTTEHSKGPSLKEIQEAEAKRAAEQEEIVAATRRAQAEQERLVQAQVPAPAPGLPLTSTWGASSSPVGTQASVWAKQTAAKAAPTSSANAKKTLAQIQKEEESRKQRAVAAAAAAATAGAQSGTSPASAAAGKRYAELASKAAPAVPNPTGGAWMTVGSNGKSKAPPPVVASPQPTSRSVSATTAPNAKARPSLSTSRSTASSNQSKANEEFSKWIKGALGKGLNSNINLVSFVQDLLILPPEVEIISDSVYASSQTLDGRRFAEEFVRRRKLADKGIVEPAANAAQGVGADSKGGAGGWSEVAKKGPAPKEESTNSAFKVVPTKKKGKR